MKKLLSLVTLVVILASCGKTDVTPLSTEPVPLNIEQMVNMIGKPYASAQDILLHDRVTIKDSLDYKKATLPVLDKEAPNPNFICEITGKDGIISKIVIKATNASHGTFKNTFHYFDNLLSSKYDLQKFYAIDADGGVNNSSKTKEELYSYLQYNAASGAALEFKTTTANIVNFCFNEADKAFIISIDAVASRQDRQ